MTDCDVAVVGCGPVGVMLALRCRQRGLRVTAVDRTAEIFPHPRAIGMDDEIQRLFHTAGLGTSLERHSSPPAGAEFVDADGQRITGIELPPGTRGPLGHPPLVMFEQPEVEAALRAAAVDAGVEFLFGHEADRIDTDDAEVTLHLRDSEGADPRTLTASWLVGADGASSTVRRRMGIELVDHGFDQPWLVVDTTLVDPELSLPDLCTQVCDPERIVTIIPGHRTRRRWEFQLTEAEADEPMTDPERITALLAPWGSTDQLRVDRAAVYRFHATVADRFRAGRVFLAGDAAHQMPPFNGQGMCTGLRDADNLAWKLAAVVEGRGGDRLLDTYDEERRPHAAGQVVHSADAGRLIDALARGEDVSTAAGYGGERPFPHLEHGLVFGDHSLVGHPVPQPDVDGAPLDTLLGAGFALVGVTPEQPGGEVWSRLETRSVPVSAATMSAMGVAEADHAVVVRPDRYVAAVTDDLVAVGDHLSSLVGR